MNIVGLFYFIHVAIEIRNVFKFISVLKKILGGILLRLCKQSTLFSLNILGVYGIIKTYFGKIGFFGHDRYFCIRNKNSFVKR